MPNPDWKASSNHRLAEPSPPALSHAYWTGAEKHDRPPVRRDRRHSSRRMEPTGGTQRQKGFEMKFSITHPIVGHPYDPELVSGVGIAAVAGAAERGRRPRVRIHGPPRADGTVASRGGPRRPRSFRGDGFRGGPDDASAAHPQYRGPAVPKSLRGRQSGGDARPPLRRTVHPCGGRGLSQARVRSAGSGPRATQRDLR